MPAFRYNGRSSRGDSVSGVLEAESPESLANHLFGSYFLRRMTFSVGTGLPSGPLREAVIDSIRPSRFGRTTS